MNESIPKRSHTNVNTVINSLLGQILWRGMKESIPRRIHKNVDTAIKASIGQLSLKDHERIHTKVLHYVNIAIKASLGQVTWNLMNVWIHTNEKPCKCQYAQPICYKYFLQASNLKKPEIFHDMENGDISRNLENGKHNFIKR